MDERNLRSAGSLDLRYFANLLVEFAKLLGVAQACLIAAFNPAVSWSVVAKIVCSRTISAS
jgi:hypothetical protein